MRKSAPPFRKGNKEPAKVADYLCPGPGTGVGPERRPAWTALKNDAHSPLHHLCSYMAMFPPWIPHYFIEEYTSPGDTVLDPFSGRGTAPLEACVRDRVGIGNDRNPLGYVLTRAKTQVPYRARIEARIDEIETGYDPRQVPLRGVPRDVRMVLHPSTSRQLVYLRQQLEWRRRGVDAFVTGMLMGILHGNSEGYLSLQMPNTFSMSPNYVRNYIREHRLKRPPRDAFELLRRKLDRCYEQPPTRGKAYLADARKMGWIEDGSVDLVITSPPYTRVVKYGAYNWLRLWFLGYRARAVDRNLLCTESMKLYLAFMKEALTEMKRVLASDGLVVLILGDVRSRHDHSTANLAELVWRDCAEPLGFRKECEPIADRFKEEAKVSRIWGDRRGQATKVERALIMQPPA